MPTSFSASTFFLEPAPATQRLRPVSYLFSFDYPPSDNRKTKTQISARIDTIRADLQSSSRVKVFSSTSTSSYLSLLYTNHWKAFYDIRSTLFARSSSRQVTLLFADEWSFAFPTSIDCDRHLNNDWCNKRQYYTIPSAKDGSYYFYRRFELKLEKGFDDDVAQDASLTLPDPRQIHFPTLNGTYPDQGHRNSRCQNR
jgi:hypothetical protein